MTFCYYADDHSTVPHIASVVIVAECDNYASLHGASFFGNQLRSALHSSLEGFPTLPFRTSIKLDKANASSSALAAEV